MNPQELLGAQLQEINQAFAVRESDLLSRLNVALADLSLRTTQLEQLQDQVAHARTTETGEVRTDIQARDSSVVVGVLQDELRERDAHEHRHAQAVDQLRAALQQSEADVRRLVRDHASQLIGMQQRAVNDRDALSLAHAEQAARLQQTAADTMERVDSLYKGRLEANQQEVASLREAYEREHQLRLGVEAKLLAAQFQATSQEQTLHTQSTRLTSQSQEFEELKSRLADERQQASAQAAELAVTQTRLTAAEDTLQSLLSHHDALQARHEQEIAHQQTLRNSLLNAAHAREQELLSKLDAENRPTGHPDQALESVRQPQDLQADKTLVRRTSIMSPPMAAATTLQELMAQHDARFVAAAYMTILKRPVDDAGLNIYVNHIRDGMAKAEIIAALATSDEGRAAACQLPGLEDLILHAQPVAPTILGRLFGRAAREGQRGILRDLRRTEGLLGRLQLESMERGSRIEAHLADIRRQVEHHHKTLSDLLMSDRGPARAATSSHEESAGQNNIGPAAASRLDPLAVARARRLLERGKAGT